MSIKRKAGILAAFLLLVLSGFSCVTNDAFVLVEMVPEKIERRPVIPADKKKVVQGRILEIIEDKGVQKVIFVRFTGSKPPVARQEGDIWADQSMSQKIGQFRVLEVYQDSVRAQVLDLTFKINAKTSAVSYETLAD